MTPTNPALVYKKAPDGLPVAGQDLVIEDVERPSEAPAGGLLVQVLYASIDPYQRGLLRSPEKKSYFPAAPLDKPLTSFSIAKVLKSSSPKYQVDDIVRGVVPIQRYFTVTAEALGSDSGMYGLAKLDADPNDQDVDIRHYLGAMGMPGITAYSSFYEIGKPKKGETIFISSAAGAVGQVVGSLAKHEGLKVIGSVGSDDKKDHLMNELKFDAAFNYKKEKPLDALKRLAPDGCDIYYDNVGGEHLDAALQFMNTFGRIVACGMISDYNAKTPDDRYAQRNMMMVIGKQLTMRGFLVFEDPSLGPKYADEHIKNLRQWIKEGTFKAKISESDISEGDKAFVGMLKGENFGKAILKLS